MRKKKTKAIDYPCDFCGKQRIDSCGLCGSSVCEDHAKPIQFHFLWYLCPNCRKSPEERLKKMDEELEGGKLEC